MSTEQAQRAVEDLYQETSARDELEDDDAEVLLQWGEVQIHQLAARDLDDAAFDEAYGHLIRLLTRINRFAAQLPDLSTEDRQLSLSRIVESAGALGLKIAQQALESFSQQPAASECSANLKNVIDLMNTLEEASEPTLPEASTTRLETVTSEAENLDTAVMPQPALPRPADQDLPSAHTEKAPIDDENTIPPEWEA